MVKLQVAISNLCDSTFCSIKICMNAKTPDEDVFVGWSRESPVIALSNKICFVQIGQVVPELCVNNFTYVNLQWLTNAE